MLAAVFVSVVLALTVPSTQGFAFSWRSCPDLSVARDFNEEIWMNGVWFETARFPFLFKRGVSCNRASYSYGADDTIRFVVDGIRDGEPIEQVDFLHLQPGRDPGEYRVYHDNYRSLPLGYRIILWNDDPTTGYFVHYGCKDFLGWFSFQNMAIYQRTPDNAQLGTIKYKLSRDIYSMEKLEEVDHDNCPDPGSGDGSGDRPYPEPYLFFR